MLNGTNKHYYDAKQLILSLCFKTISFIMEHHQSYFLVYTMFMTKQLLTNFHKEVYDDKDKIKSPIKTS